MPFSILTLNKLVDAFHGKATYTAPTNLYIGLSTTTPTAAGGNVTEPSGGAYARVAIAPAAWASAASGSSANTVAITFPTPTAAWGTVTHFVIYDAATAGNFQSFAALAAAQSVPSGVQLSIPIGQATDSIS
jgi:hypothetical protein